MIEDGAGDGDGRDGTGFVPSILFLSLSPKKRASPREKRGTEPQLPLPPEDSGCRIARHINPHGNIGKFPLPHKQLYNPCTQTLDFRDLITVPITFVMTGNRSNLYRWQTRIVANQRSECAACKIFAFPVTEFACPCIWVCIGYADNHGNLHSTRNPGTRCTHFHCYFPRTHLQVRCRSSLALSPE